MVLGIQVFTQPTPQLRGLFPLSMLPRGLGAVMVGDPRIGRTMSIVSGTNTESTMMADAIEANVVSIVSNLASKKGLSSPFSMVSVDMRYPRAL